MINATVIATASAPAQAQAQMLAPGTVLNPGLIHVNPRQRLTPLLKHIPKAKWEFTPPSGSFQSVCDFSTGSSGECVFVCLFACLTLSISFALTNSLALTY